MSKNTAIALQTKISDRVALVSQTRTVERLASEGVISETVAAQIIQVD